MVVGSHVIEHLANPLFFFSESIRVCKPGGWVSIEAPSEVSVMLPGFPFQRDGFYSTSFFDDPTHIGRPWTTQAFYRLAKAFDLSSIHVSKDFNIFAWVGMQGWSRKNLFALREKLILATYCRQARQRKSKIRKIHS
jgi:SAM-dependent methyltransferase